MKPSAILLAFFLLAQPAFAQTQMQLTAQAGARDRAADARLNTEYQALSRSLSPEARDLLRQSERTWVAFRDAECKLRASGVQGGSIYPMIYANCTADLAEARTRQLRDLGHCQEGDLTCPR